MLTKSGLAMSNSSELPLQPDDAFIQDLIACKAQAHDEGAADTKTEWRPNVKRQNRQGIARSKVDRLIEARQKEVRQKAKRQQEASLQRERLQAEREKEERLQAERLKEERLQEERLQEERLQEERLRKEQLQREEQLRREEHLREEQLQREEQLRREEQLQREERVKTELEPESPTGIEVGEVEERGEQVAPPTKDRRQAVRYDISLPVSCYPMLPSMEVDPAQMADGIIVDISATGVSIILETQHVEIGQLFVIAVDSDRLGWRFADLKVVGVRSCHDKSSHIQCSLDGPLKRVFSEDQLFPILDQRTFKYVFPVDDRVLVSLCSIGALQRMQLDQVLVCPDCHAVPTLRRGCSICLSNETEKATMIHHFACAHVDFKDAFDQGGEITCPKCLGRKMIIGADYEYLNGPTRCRECGHNDLEEILIGHCMACSNRFPFESAESIEIIGYRVNRLDPLAIISNN